MTHYPGVCECPTCGHPCLRPEGHASWCSAIASASVLSPDPIGLPGTDADGAAAVHAGPDDGARDGEVARPGPSLIDQIWANGWHR